MIIEGESVAAKGSCLFCRFGRLRLLFDCGTKPPESASKISMILITHGHDDHHKMLYSIMSEYDSFPPKVYVPVELVDGIVSILNAFTSLNTAGAQTICDYAKHVVGISDCDEFFTPDKNYKITAFKTFHGEDTPSIGYTISKRRAILKSKYKNFEGSELAKLGKSGVKTKELVYMPVCAYTGDTTPEVFESDYMRSLLKVDGVTIITECTFFDEKDKARADKTFHSHYDDLAQILEDNKNVHFRLTHFSARYTKRMSEITEKIEESHPNTKII